MKYKDYTDQQIRVYAKSKPIKNWRKEMKNPKSNHILLNMVPKVRGEMFALDLGCGEGYHTEDLRNLGYIAFGIELSEKRVKDAHKLDRDYVYHGDVHDLSAYEDNTMDLVFMHEVLEHSLYPVKVLQEIYRVLIPNSTLLASLPLEGHWRKPQESVDHDFNVADNHPWKATAHRLYSTIKFAGFSDFTIKLYNLDSLQFKQEYKLDQEIKGFRPHAFVEAIK